MRASLLITLASAVLLCAAPASADDEPNKFLVISAPKLSKVVYFILAPKPAKWARPLVSRDLKSPRGVAVDNIRMNLFIADPAAADGGKIFYYKLILTPAGRLTTDLRQRIAVSNIEARWVSVDLGGNIFFTNERDNMIQKITYHDFQKGIVQPKTLYNGIRVPAVSAPGGIATDGFNIFWTNKALGTEVGSVMKAFETPPEADVVDSIEPVADNALKAYGLCISQNNLYYTENRYVWGVKKTGGAHAPVTDTLSKPRGCASDGDGTVYVADQGGGAIYSFPGNMAAIHPEPMAKILDFTDSFGLAVCVATPSAAWRAATASMVVLVGAALLH